MLYPDKVIISKPLSDDPYERNVTYEVIYSGACKCFLDKKSALRITKAMDNNYCCVIPNRSMPDIGERYKVGVKYHNTQNGKNCDLVGFVLDFARYNRVCNLYFQIIKEEMVYEDMPDEPTATGNANQFGFDNNGG